MADQAEKIRRIIVLKCVDLVSQKEGNSGFFTFPSPPAGSSQDKYSYGAEDTQWNTIVETFKNIKDDAAVKLTFDYANRPNLTEAQLNSFYGELNNDVNPSIKEAAFPEVEGAGQTPMEAITNAVSSALVTATDFYGITNSTGVPEETGQEERLVAQCILLDLINPLSEKNYTFRNNKQYYDNNPNTICMSGDNNYFSSYVNGSNIKGMFLDFTPHQLSSLVPNITFYKVQQDGEGGQTNDYLIPFSTHAAWQNGRTTYGTIENLIIAKELERPMDVGVKSFNWVLEGSNPVSSRRDISAKLTLFSNSLNNFAEPFFIYSTTGGHKKPFRYVDLILRSGKKFDEAHQYRAQYYTFKVVIGWNTNNKDLFTNDEIKSLKQNTTTLMLTLIDHQFNFAQDGTFTIDINYRAYFEGLLWENSADCLKTSDQTKKVNDAKRSYEKVASDTAPKDEDEEDRSEENSKKLEEARKKYEEILLETNKESLQTILNNIPTYIVGIKQAEYKAFKDEISKATGDRTANAKISTFVEYQPKPNEGDFLNEKKEQVREALTKTTEGTTNPDLSTIVPKLETGIYYISYFFLSDLFNYVINNTYENLKEEPNKPNFLFGSAILRDNILPIKTNTYNIFDIPVSVDWFVEWFTSSIISQNKSQYMLLYFIRDFASKLINNILASSCNRTTLLPLKNKFNISNFFVKKVDGNDPIVEKRDDLNRDVPVDTLSRVIQTNPIDNKNIDSSKIKQYVAIYCQDASSPNNVQCEKDLKNGIYHFYFGRDRGLIKNISFSRSQVQGLRELNYVRESNGYDLQQLMTPYDVDVKMVGNNLFINGMMIYINPSGFGRKVGEPYETDSISYSLKLGGYHTIYRVESTINTNGFETSLKARWVGSGAEKRSIVTNSATEGSVADTGVTSQEVATINESDVLLSQKSGYNYSVFASVRNRNNEGGG